MANDIMIDIEALDTTPYCVILSIGVVRFDPKGSGVVDKMTLLPTIEEQTEVFNRVINDDTIRWWGEQNPAALEEAFTDKGRISFHECMDKLYKYGWNRNAVWSHGAAFDIVACETAMRQTLTQYSNPIPWPFYKVRDTRTLYDLAGVRLTDGGHVTSHRAVDDAERQAIVVQKAYRKLGLADR